ncbi:MAG: hypothetical protein CMQ69_06305 [Gammaproteobacteria bacterium]|nr:hypothetical protein [Gammaproteobacteria bacterium]
MSEKEKQADNDPERTLMTLDQLSQTIEVMTSVVNRLRQHLSEQLREQAVRAQQDVPDPSSETEDSSRAAPLQLDPHVKRSSVPESQKVEQTEQKTEAASDSREPFVVEIRQQEASPTRKSDKTLH